MPREKEIKTDERPWGGWSLYRANSKVASVKILTLNPRGKLSVQKHEKRAEEWYLVAGKVKIYRGKESDKLNEIILEQRNENVVIPQGVWHSLENIGEQGALIVEVATGFYDEEDIERAQDKYGRV